MGLHAVSASLRLAGASLPSVLHEAGMCIVAQHQRCTIGLRTATRVPCCDLNAFHCVQVLAGLGNQTQQKLLNIPEAAAAVGVTNLQIPHTSVSKGGRLLKMSLKSRHPLALALCGTAVPLGSLQLCGLGSAWLKCTTKPIAGARCFVCQPAPAVVHCVERHHPCSADAAVVYGCTLVLPGGAAVAPPLCACTLSGARLAAHMAIKAAFRQHGSA